MELLIGLYVTVAAIAALPLSCFWIHNWWKDLVKPDPPTFEGCAWGLAAGCFTAVLWPLALFVLLFWGTVKLVHHVFSHRSGVA